MLTFWQPLSLGQPTLANRIDKINVFKLLKIKYSILKETNLKQLNKTYRFEKHSHWTKWKNGIGVSPSVSLLNFLPISLCLCNFPCLLLLGSYLFTWDVLPILLSLSSGPQSAERKKKTKNWEYISTLCPWFMRKPPMSSLRLPMSDPEVWVSRARRPVGWWGRVCVCTCLQASIWTLVWQIGWKGVDQRICKKISAERPLIWVRQLLVWRPCCERWPWRPSSQKPWDSCHLSVQATESWKTRAKMSKADCPLGPLVTLERFQINLWKRHPIPKIRKL